MEGDVADVIIYCLLGPGGEGGVEVLLRETGVAEHVGHVGGAGDVPGGEVLVEGECSRKELEHCIHTARIPHRNILIERRL